MSYTWTNGELITAAKLNQTGGGGDIFFDITEEDGTLDKTWTEILTAVSAGKIARILTVYENGATCDYVLEASTDEEFWYVYTTKFPGPNGWYQAASASGYPYFAD